jgi:hypothetical protein
MLREAPQIAIADPIQQVLARMAVGEWKQLNDPRKTLKDGAGGDSHFTRAVYDAGGAFASDNHVLHYVTGDYPADFRGIMIYSGGTYDTRRHGIRIIGSGHSNGASNIILAFDVLGACQTLIERSGNPRLAPQSWEPYSDPNPLSAVDPPGQHGRNRHPNWPELPYYRQPSPDLRWPQPVTRNVLGPKGNCGPYALHTYSAVAYDAVHDCIWVCGGSVGSTGQGGIDPRATWRIDHADRAWHMTMNAGGGGNQAAILMAPDGRGTHFFHTTNATRHWAYDIAQDRSRLTGDLGTVNDGSNGGAPMLIEGLTEPGHWDIIRYPTGRDFKPRFNCHPRQWPLPRVAQPGMLVPANRQTPYIGATPAFGENSGYVYVPERRLIYAITDLKGGIQTIDPFQGRETGQPQWAVANVPTSGDLPNAGDPNGDLQTGFNNRVTYLPPPYSALVVTMNWSRGDVYLIRL